MAWRVARSLLTYQEQLNEAYPGRNTLSDGFIGDTDHSKRTSDHNPWCGPGVVTAGDYTHDPSVGLDIFFLAEALRLSFDPRIKYVICNNMMFSSYPTSTTPAWEWRPYTGSNPHTKHFHLSVQCNDSKDSTRLWALPGEDEMTKDDWKKLRRIVRSEAQRAVQQLAVGKEENWNKKYMNLKDIETRLNEAIEKVTP